MVKQYGKFFKKALFCLAVFSIIALSACSKTPLQKALDSDPDILAQAINGNIRPIGYTIGSGDCIKLVIDGNYNNPHSEEVIKFAKDGFNEAPEDIIKECSGVFSELADHLQMYTDFKGLTEKDFEQRPIWEHYYKSSIAKFKVKSDTAH